MQFPYIEDRYAKVTQLDGLRIWYTYLDIKRIFNKAYQRVAKLFILIVRFMINLRYLAMTLRERLRGAGSFIRTMHAY